MQESLILQQHRSFFETACAVLHVALPHGETHRKNPAEVILQTGARQACLYHCWPFKTGSRIRQKAPVSWKPSAALASSNAVHTQSMDLTSRRHASYSASKDKLRACSSCRPGVLCLPNPSN